MKRRKDNHSKRVLRIVVILNKTVSTKKIKHNKIN